jgi:hypothetical protein
LITLQDKDRKIIFSKPFYRFTKERNAIRVIAEKNTYKPRELVRLRLDSEIPLSNLNIAVTRRLDPNLMEDITWRLMLEKPTRNSLYSILDSDILNKKQKEDLLTLNTEILTQLHSSENSLYDIQIPDYDMHIIQGNVKFDNSDSINSNKVYLTLPGNPLAFSTSTIGSDGSFCISSPFLPENKTLVFHIPPTTNRDTRLQIDIKDPFINSKPDFSIEPLSIPESFIPYLERTNIYRQLKVAYSINDKSNPGQIKNKGLVKFYGEPDQIFILDDYTRFPVMEEVFREIIRNVHIRINKGNFSLRVLDNNRNETFKENPMILVDGLPVFDVNAIMGIDPLLIESIEVVTSMYYLGKNDFHGIVFLNSYEKDFAGMELTDDYFKKSYYTIDEIPEFITPNYDTNEKRNSKIPDFRNLLYWDTKVEADINSQQYVEFYTSDETGYFEVVVTGIDTEGQVIRHTTFFEVR